MNAQKNVRPRGAWFIATFGSVLALLDAIVRLRVGWLLPLILVLFLVGLIFALLNAAGPLAPFVYPLF